MPARMEEMDERTPFATQLGSGEGPIVLVNEFRLSAEEDVDDFIEAWAEAARLMREQPGFVSTQLHRGIGGSLTFVNVANWESAEALREAVTAPAFLATHGGYPDGTVSSPHAFAAVSVDGVC